eukprot:4054198-Alexandrium_andersonii.AAC.1
MTRPAARPAKPCDSSKPSARRGRQRRTQRAGHAWAGCDHPPRRTRSGLQRTQHCPKPGSTGNRPEAKHHSQTCQAGRWLPTSDLWGGMGGSE